MALVRFEIRMISVAVKIYIYFIEQFALLVQLTITIIVNKHPTKYFNWYKVEKEIKQVLSFVDELTVQTLVILKTPYP